LRRVSVNIVYLFTDI